MRAFLASSIGVACAPPPSPSPLAPTRRSRAPPRRPGRRAAAPREPAICRAAPSPCRWRPLGAPGSHPRDRATTTAPAAGTRVCRPATYGRFSLVGVVWDDAAAELHGRVQVRTRAAGTGSWSGWQDVETHNDDARADLGSAERARQRRARQPPRRCGSATPTASRCASPGAEDGRGPRARPTAPGRAAARTRRPRRGRPRSGRGAHARRPGPAVATPRRPSTGLRRQRRPRPARRHRDPGPATRPPTEAEHRRGGRAVAPRQPVHRPAPAHRHPRAAGAPTRSCARGRSPTPRPSRPPSSTTRLAATTTPARRPLRSSAASTATTS